MPQAPAKKTKAPAARTRKPAAAKKPAAKPAAKKPAAKKPAAAVKKPTAAQMRKAVDTSADLSDDVLESVAAGQRAAIEAVRKFVEAVDEALPAIGGRPSRRETVIDAALEMADKLVTTQYDFLRSVVRSADRTLGEPKAGKK